MRLTITEKGIETEDLNFNDALQMIFTTLLHLMNSAVDNFTETEEEKEQLTESIYDAVNAASGSILSKFDPTRDPHPEVDVEDIMARQDMIINDEFSKLKASNPRLFKKRQKEFKKVKDEFAYKKALHESKAKAAKKT